MFLRNKEIDVSVDEVKPFVNEKYTGFIIRWSGNIGFGEYTLYRSTMDDKWYGDSECMDKGDDKEFLALLLEDFINQMEISG